MRKIESSPLSQTFMARADTVLPLRLGGPPSCKSRRLWQPAGTVLVAGWMVLNCCFPLRLSAFIESSSPALPNFDKRKEGRTPAEASPDSQAAALQLCQRVPGLRVDRDEILAAPAFICSPGALLCGPDAQGGAISPQTTQFLAPDDPYLATKAFLTEHAPLFGFGADTLNGARIKREFITPHNGLKTVVWEQQLDGVQVFQGLLISHTTPKNELVNISSRFVPDVAAAADAAMPNRAAILAAPPISAAQAVAIAAENVGESLSAAAVTAVELQPAGADQRQRFTAPPLLGEADAHLVWLPITVVEARLCWEVILTGRSRSEMFRVLVDAEVGEAMVRHGLTSYISDASYRVYTSDSPSPFSPGHPTPLTNQPPVVPRQLLTLGAINTTASPNGWINDGANETLGNNVDAHTDRDANDIADLPRPQGSPQRVFDFPLDLSQEPGTYTNAAVVQLFYWNNFMHDKLYELGFTEAAGNFQSNNFGRGGLGSDAVQADAQDGSGFNNANFSTPQDGSPGRMQMFLFNGPTPDRDGDLDAEIVLHEYTHGLSNRRVGGGVGISELQTGGMGEGWSDFYGLSLLSEPGDDVDAVYAAGGYATFQLSGLTQNYYFGIRRYPYCTDTNKNPLTFKDIDPNQASTHTGIPRSPIIVNTADEVHNQGEVWCVTLWDARVNLIKKHGFAVGNQLILRLVTDGMNLSPADPNFLQARDAILQADQVNNGGANLGELWSAFAKRGMGFSATSPSSSTTIGVVEAFDTPVFVSIPASATEGGPSPLVGRVSLPGNVSSSVTVTLGSSDPTEVTVPASVVIPAGTNAALFNLTILDDTVLDGSQSVTISATVPSFATGIGVIVVHDNETATLSLSPPPGPVAEGIGSYSAVVSVSAAPAKSVTVMLSSSDTSEIQVPPSVTIPAGQVMASFNVAVVDDTEIDGTQTATITAHVQNWTDGTTTVNVTDNENRLLTVSLPVQASEGNGTLANAGSVQISGILTSNLVVSLSSSDLSELLVPATATILAGQTLGRFNLTLVDDAIIDGNQAVTVTAQAAGWVDGSAMMTVLDDETPPTPADPNPPHLATNIAATTDLSWSLGLPEGPELIVNGGFETGDFTGWTKETSGSGDFVINDGVLIPLSGDGPLPPFEGNFNTVTDQSGPGAHVIYQQLTIPTNATGPLLRWADRIRNHAGTFADNQVFRVEVRDTNNVVLVVAYSTQPGDPALNDWVQRSFDLSAFKGQTIRVAFVEQDALFYFNVHIDKVSVTLGAPTPTTFDVYFGTNPTPGPAEFQGSTTNTSWDLPTLAPLTTYYWQIVARRLGQTAGPVWQFTTRGVDHFEWSAIASPQVVAQPFAAAVAAKDDMGNTVSNFTGTVNLSAVAGGGTITNVILGDVSYQSTSTGNWTLGYAFTPNTNITVTHVRHYFGTKVSIWTDAGTLLATANVTSVPGTWVTTQLASPLTLTAGMRYRVAAYTAGGQYYWRTDGPGTFSNGTIDASYNSSGDAFPVNTDSARWWLVDLRYVVGSFVAVPISPTVSGNFSNGVWSANLTVLQAASNAVVRADDANGHTGSSNPFEVLLQDDLGVTLTDAPDPVAVGANLTYTVTVTNGGPAAATMVTVTNLLPASVTFVSATPSQGMCANLGGTVVCDLGTLPGASAATVTIVVTPGATGDITNRVSISRGEPDPVAANNLASAVTAVRTPALTIAGTTVVEGNVGSTNALLTVTLAPAALGAVTVNFATANDTAFAGADYQPTNGTLTFLAGEATRTITVPVFGDKVAEANETFFVTLSGPVGAVISNAVATAMILDDDLTPSDSPRVDFWMPNGTVNAILETNGVIYLGGSFTELGTNSGKFIPFDPLTGDKLAGFPIVDRTVNAVIDDGQGGWFLGGEITAVDGVPRYRLAHILSDRTLDPNFVPRLNSTVFSLLLDGTNLYAGGTFTAITNAGVSVSRLFFAVLDPLTGAPRSFGIEPGFNNTVFALARKENTLYVGGSFTNVTDASGSVSRLRVAALDITTGLVTPFQAGADSTVNTLALSDNTLYIGGVFGSVAGQPRARLAAVNAETGTPVAWNPGCNNTVLTLALEGNTVYAAGFFTAVTNGGSTFTRNRIVALDATTGMPTTWNPNANNTVRALAVRGNDLIAGGDFTSIGGQSDRRRLAAIDKTTGLATGFDPDVSGAVLAIAANNNLVYAGGSFSFTRGIIRNRLAALDAATGVPTVWDPNANNTALTLAASGTNIFAGGTFTNVGGQSRTRFATLTADTGQVVGSAVLNPTFDSTVRAFAVSGNNLFVGGDFTNVTLSTTLVRRGVAALKITNSVISAINTAFSATAIPSSGNSSNVLTLAVSGTNLYIGGTFNNIASQARSRLAVVNTNTGALMSWNPRANSNVLSIAVSGTNVYVAGAFTTITNTSGSVSNRNRIAAINSATGNVTAWNPNASSTVFAAAPMGTNVYAGGSFTTTIGGQSRSRLAELNTVLNTSQASAWNPDAQANVATILVSNGRVYVGGQFNAIGRESRQGFAVFEANSPPVVTTSGGAVTFIENDAPTVVDAGVTVADLNQSTLVSATVRIATNYATGEDVLSFTPQAGISGIFQPATGALQLSGTAPVAAYQATLRSVTYRNTSENPATATRTVEFTASDGTATSAPATRDIIVLSVNDPPSFTKGPDPMVQEDSGPQTVLNWATNLRAGPPEEAGQLLNFIVANENPALFAAQPAITPTGTLTFTPAPDANGGATVTVVLKDDGGTANGGQDTSAPQMFVITVQPVNDPPVAQSQTVTVNEDTPTALMLVATDVESDPLTYSISVPGHGALSGAPPNLTYTPVANYHGPDSFTFTASDSQATSAVAVVSLNVLSVNDAPVADASATAPEVISPNNTNAVVIFDGSRSYDIEGDPLQYSWYVESTSGLLATGVVATNMRPVGANALKLVVSDGQNAGTNHFTVRVITAAQAVQGLIDKINAAGLKQNTQPLLATLEAAIASFERGDFIPGVNQLEAFQHKVRAQVGPEDPVLADMLISMAQVIIDAVMAPRGGGGGVLAPATRMDFTAVLQEPNGRVRLHFPGRLGHIYLIQASTNLQNWETIGTARHIEKGAFDFEDVNAAQYPKRYYRIVAP